MPDVATPRNRTVSISGTGGFGVDSLGSLPVNPFRPKAIWTTSSVINGIYAFASATDPSGGFSPPILLGPPYDAPTPGQDQWYLAVVFGPVIKVARVNSPHPAHPYLWVGGTGLFSFTLTVHCVQHFNPGPYEACTLTDFSVTGSSDIVLRDQVTGLSTTVSISATMTYAEAVAGGIPVAAYFPAGTYSIDGYSFGFGGCPVHFENTCTIGFDQPGLISASTGIDTHFGKPRLHGNGGAVSFKWDGAESDVNRFWSGTGPAPGAGIEFFPSWAMSADAAVYHYRDASEVGATLQHFNGTDLLGEFASGSSYRYPASGLVHYARLGSFVPGSSRVTPSVSVSGMQPGSTVPTDLNYDPSLVLTGWNYGPIGGLLQKPVTLAHPYDTTPSPRLTQFRVKPAWANGYGTYIKSAHPLPSAASLVPKLGGPYPQGTITWDDTHRFLLFEDTGPNTKLTAAVASGATDLPVLSEAGWTVGDAASVGFDGVIVSAVASGHLTVSPLGLSYPKGTAVVRGYVGSHEGARWVGSASGFSFPGASAPFDAAPSVHKVSGAGIDGFAVEIATLGQALVDTSLRYLLLHQGYRYAQLRAKLAPLSVPLTGDVAMGDTDLPVTSSDGFQVGDALIIDPYGTADPVSVTAIPPTVSANHLGVSALASGHSSGDAVVKAGSPRALFALNGSSVGTIAWLLAAPATTLASDATAGDTDLPVASSTGFAIGDVVDIGGPLETVTVSGVSPGHLTVSAIGSDHAAGASIHLKPGSWHTFDLDLSKPEYEVPLGQTTYRPATSRVAPDLFISTPALGFFGATSTVQPLEAGTFTFDWLEGQLKTGGTRTPRLLFPFLDGFGDAVDLTFYEPSPGRTFPFTSGVGQWMTWVVNGVRGATVRPVGDIESVSDKWDYLAQWFDSGADNPESVTLGFPKPNDTGITIVKGVLGDPDPLSVFGPNNQGEFEFDPTDGYGVKGSPRAISGRLRPFIVSAYYGCGDLTATSGGYGAVVAFSLDWLFDGEVNVNVAGATSGSGDVLLADNDTGATLDSAAPDDDGMARLHGKYGVVHPKSNLDDSVQWSQPPRPPAFTTLSAVVAPGDSDLPVVSSSGATVGERITVGFFDSDTTTITAITPGHLFVSPAVTVVYGIGEPLRPVPSTRIDYTTLGKLLNSDWLGGAVNPKDGGYWTVGNPPSRADVVILDRYQTFLLTLGGGAGKTPFNLEDDVGGYHRADVVGGRVRYKHADLTSPPFVTTAFATDGPSDAEPRMAVWLDHRIVLLFTRADADVYETVSHSEGITWSTPEMAFPGGKHPLPAVGRGRELLRAAYVAGNLKGTIQYPGDPSPSAPFTFVDASAAPLSVEDDSFGFTAAHEGPARWWLVVVISGESEVSDWFSNDGQTWLRVT